MTPSVVHAHVREPKMWTAPDTWKVFVELGHRGLKMAKSKLDMQTHFKKLGYINPCDVKPCVGYTFALPVAAHRVIP